jgi:trk system potassium uptake protein TrkH
MAVRIHEIYNEVAINTASTDIKKIIFYTIVIESITSIVLYTQFIKTFSPAESIWFSVFHSVSAFCNAGFSTFADSLISYKNNPVVILSISANIISRRSRFCCSHRVCKFKNQEEKTFFQTIFTSHKNCTPVNNHINFIRQSAISFS